MLDLVTAVLIAVHLLTAYVGSALPGFCVLIEWRARRRDQAEGLDFARLLARHSLYLLALGAVLGLLLLLVALSRGDPAYHDALWAVSTSRYRNLTIEFIFSIACLVGYALAWERFGRARWLHRLLAVVATTNLLYHFPALFIVVSNLAVQSELRGAEFQFTTVFFQAENLTRFWHHVVAALAVSGIYVSLAARRAAESTSADSTGDDGDSAGAALTEVAVLGARITLAALVLQLAIGLILLVQVPRATQNWLLGHDLVLTVTFFAGVFLALLLMHQIAEVAWGAVRKQVLVRSAWMIAIVLVLMVSVRYQTRSRLFTHALSSGRWTASAEAHILRDGFTTTPALQFSRRGDDPMAGALP